jgi:hypothetical protein
VAALVGSAPLFLASQGTPAVRLGAIVAVAVGIVTLGACLFPIGSSAAGQGRPKRRVDERDIMFARARLQPGSSEYERYYAMRPENRESDDRTRSLPGLLSPDAAKADPLYFASAEAAFRVTEALRDDVDGPVASDRVEIEAGELSTIVKRAARNFGAREVGIAQLEPYHIYTHVGRGSGEWGEPVRLDHRWAVALTVEMDHAAMSFAPAAPVVAESARQYVESAKACIELAALIRGLGYSARAHIDGNYRVIAPLVARDAGLGEIGRMGILMTPRLGPRVRLGVVTTAAPRVSRSGSPGGGAGRSTPTVASATGTPSAPTAESAWRSVRTPTRTTPRTISFGGRRAGRVRRDGSRCGRTICSTGAGHARVGELQGR